MTIMTGAGIRGWWWRFSAALAFMVALGISIPSIAQTGPRTLTGMERAEKYVHAWADLNSALVRFSIASGGFNATRQESPESRWVPYEAQRKRFADALLVLIKTRPPQTYVASHWVLVPLFEDLLAGMTLITEGMQRNETAIEERGWVWFGMTVAMLKEATNEIESE